MKRDLNAREIKVRGRGAKFRLFIKIYYLLLYEKYWNWIMFLFDCTCGKEVTVGASVPNMAQNIVSSNAILWGFGFRSQIHK